MRIPGFHAESSLSSHADYRATVSSFDAFADDVVEAAFCVNSPCIGVGGGGQICFRVPIVNRRICFRVPSLGRWRIRVCGLPFGFRPSLQRC